MLPSFPYTRYTDGKVFRLGQLVCGWADGGDHLAGVKFWGTLDMLYSSTGHSEAQRQANPKYERKTVFGIVVVKTDLVVHYKAGDHAAIWANTAQPVNLLDITKPVQTRAGWPVHSLTRSPYKDRPISALIVMPDRALTLSYTEHGMFYDGFEQALDLVNIGENP